MGTLIIKEQFRCFYCGGKGRIFKIKKGVGVTGLAFILNALRRNRYDVCSKCNGRGWIYQTAEIVEI